MKKATVSIISVTRDLRRSIDCVDWGCGAAFLRSDVTTGALGWADIEGAAVGWFCCVDIRADMEVIEFARFPACVVFAVAVSLLLTLLENRRRLTLYHFPPLFPLLVLLFKFAAAFFISLLFLLYRHRLYINTAKSSSFNIMQTEHSVAQIQRAIR